MRLTPVRSGSERSDLLRGVPPLSRLMFICLKRFFVDLLFVIRVCTFLDVRWLVDSLWLYFRWLLRYIGVGMGVYCNFVRYYRKLLR
jgi:hypothetical protein